MDQYEIFIFLSLLSSVNVSIAFLFLEIPKELFRLILKLYLLISLGNPDSDP